MDNKIAIQFTDTVQNIVTAASGFHIKIKEASFVHGPVTPVTLTVVSCELQTTDKPNDTIVITTNKPFSNASGTIQVVYDASTGGLYGVGGVVESFIKEFTPEGLTPNMGPNPLEYLTANLMPRMDVYPVLPASTEVTDKLNAALSVESMVIPIMYRNIGEYQNELLMAKITTLCTVTDISGAIP